MATPSCSGRASSLLLLLLLLPICSCAPIQFEVIELYPSVSKSRRSAPGGAERKRVVVNTTQGQPQMLKLHFGSSVRLLEVSQSSNVLYARSRLKPVPENAMDILKVLDSQTGRALRLPTDNLPAHVTDEYNFLLRSHYFHKFVCMDITARVYTKKKQAHSLPEDCLWRGKVLPKTVGAGHQQVVFSHAFYPNNKTLPLAPGKRRWYLGFVNNYDRPERGFRLAGHSRKTRFSALPYPIRRDRPVAQVSTELKIGSSQVVNAEHRPLELVAKQHAAEKYNNSGCVLALRHMRAHSLRQQRHSRRVLSSLRRLPQLLARGSREVLDAGSARRTLRRFWRLLPLQFLARRGRWRCRRIEFIVAFQSAEVAEWLMERPECSGVPAGRFRRRLRRRFRRRRSELRRLLVSVLGARTAGRGSLLKVLRRGLGAKLPSLRSVRRGLLLRWQSRRLQKRLNERFTENVGVKSSLVEAETRRRQLDDSAKFLVALGSQEAKKLFRRSRRRRGRRLVSWSRFLKLRQRWRAFPKFYLSLHCRFGPARNRQ